MGKDTEQRAGAWQQGSEKDTVPRSEADAWPTIWVPRGKKMTLAGSEDRALLRPPNKSLVFTSKWMCFPGVTKASSGGLAFRRVEITVEET